MPTQLFFKHISEHFNYNTCYYLLFIIFTMNIQILLFMLLMVIAKNNLLLIQCTILTVYIIVKNKFLQSKIQPTQRFIFKQCGIILINYLTLDIYINKHWVLQQCKQNIT